MRRWFLDLSIRTKLLLGFTAVLLVLVVLSATAYRSTRASLETAAWVQHTQQVIGTAQQALGSLVDMETGYRGFLVTGREEFLEPYRSGRERFQKAMAELKRLTADNPALVQRWEEIERRAAAWQAAVVQPGIRVRREVASGRAPLQRVVEFAARNGGKAQMDGIRSVFAQAVGEEERLLQQRRQRNERDAGLLLNVLLWGSVLAVGLGATVALALARTLTRPMRQLLNALRDAAEGEGDLTRRLPVTSQDEVGEVARWFNAFVEKIHRTVAGVRQLASEVASSAEQVAASSEQMARGAVEISQAVQSVASAAEQQVRSVGETTETVRQISRSLQDVAHNTSTAAQAAQQATETAREGGGRVQQVTRTMGEIREGADQAARVVAVLGEKSKNIGRIVSVISGIASQTNLLALNAAIEAARAGDQGRGFAVVAEEVRKLAQESSQAADQIAEIVREIQEETERVVTAISHATQNVERGVHVVEEAGSAFQNIRASVESVTGQTEAISAATQQLSASAQQIEAIVTQLLQTAQQNSASAEQVSAATEEISANTQELSESAQRLAKAASTLQQLVGQFAV